MNSKGKEANKEKKGAEAFADLASNIGKLVGDASEKAKSSATKAQKVIVKAIDQNEDGTVDVKDLSKAMGEAKLEMDKKFLRPVFAEDLSFGGATVSTFARSRPPCMIRIVEIDKKRSVSAACNEAVGYWTTVKGTNLLNIYEDSAPHLGLHFHPHIGKTFYCLDPFRNHFYVSLDEYFKYLKDARLAELEMIAHSLGAKRMKVTFKEKKKTFVAKSAKGGAKAGVAKSASSFDQTDQEFSDVTFTKELKFSGHDAPIVPQLVYFKNEPDIENLIEMRTKADNGNKIMSKDCMVECAKSLAIKENEAAEIDAVLHGLKVSGSASFSSEVQRESRTILEYSIEF